MAWIKLTRRSTKAPLYVNTNNFILVERLNDYARLRFTAASGDDDSSNPYSVAVAETVDEVMRAIGQSDDGSIVPAP